MKELNIDQTKLPPLKYALAGYDLPYIHSTNLHLDWVLESSYAEDDHFFGFTEDRKIKSDKPDFLKQESLK